jgi:uncharacterized RDD family membrane protein YckC
MKRPPAIPETEDLLNLPLKPRQDSAPPDSAVDEALHQESFLFREPTPAAEPIDDQDEPAVQHGERSSVVSLGQRLEAGLLDLGASISALCIVVLGAWILGVQLRGSVIPAFASFVASFSFLYHVVPLTFWGQTPGMAVAGLVARTQQDQPLTIQQTILRWLGAAITVIALGLPFLLATSGRSLADRLSHCELHPSGADA